MNDGSSREIAVRLQITRFEPASSGWADVRCLGCGAPLQVHQPDQEHPDRLLGTCGDCHGWVIADFAPDSEEGVFVYLPGGTFFQDLDDEE